MADNDQIATNENGDNEVLDLSEKEDLGLSRSKYLINSYGADYTVDSLVVRLKRGDIYIPPFQRGYVWTQTQASKFIESLLLGLPVPGIFMSKDGERRLLVIDGQQRLKTLQFFYQGMFDKREFDLRNVKEPYEGKTYNDLSDGDRRELDDAIIHATIVQQIEPYDDSSIYHIFERLNTGGTKLQPQEIRASVYHGDFITLLHNLNENEAWRSVYGQKHKRGKDEELILRFLALYNMEHEYSKPMNEFLNHFANVHRDLKHPESPLLANSFEEAVDLVNRSLGKSAFRPQRTLNAAVYDAVMVGIARRLNKAPVHNTNEVAEAYQRLISNVNFLDAVTASTTDEENVRQRIHLATEAFAGVQ